MKPNKKGRRTPRRRENPEAARLRAELRALIEHVAGKRELDKEVAAGYARFYRGQTI